MTAQNPVPLIDAEHCTGCQLCVQVCPTGALGMQGLIAVIVDAPACDYNGYCERICPVQAIRRPFQIVSDLNREVSMNGIIYPGWKDKVIFSAEGPQPQILADNDKIKVIVAGLEPAQRVPAHPEVMAVYHFLEGSGWMIVDGERLPVEAGATIVTEDGAVRGVEAGTRLVFLAVRIA